MKVLMFGWEFPPHITGGLGTACYGITKGLTNLGTEVLFVVPKIFGEEDKSFLNLVSAEEFNVHFKTSEHKIYFENFSYIEIDSKLVPYVSPTDFELHKNNTNEYSDSSENIFSSQFKFSGKYGENLMSEVFRYSIIAGKFAEESKFDVIHAHDWLTYPAGIAAKKSTGKPLIIHVHATEFDRSGDDVNQSVYNIEKMGMEEADKIITVSDFTRNIVINRYGIESSKVVTVYNGIDFELGPQNSYSKTVKDKIVTFLGRVTFQKGPDYFVESAKKILDRCDNVRFVMAGSGDMLKSMITRVAALGISDKFHFTGFLKGEDVNKMLEMSDVYVMPSVSEPFGISPLEAMRSNVPVIISKQSGVAEILKHAIKVDFWDIDAMSDAIYGLLKYDGLSSMFENYSRSEVETLKWDNAADKINQIYETVI